MKITSTKAALFAGACCARRRHHHLCLTVRKMLLDDLTVIQCGDGLLGWSWKQGGDVEEKGEGKEPGQGTK